MKKGGKERKGGGERYSLKKKAGTTVTPYNPPLLRKILFQMRSNS